MKKNIISCLLIGISLSLFWFSFNKSACANYDKQCFVSPIPTNEIVSPTISLMPSVSLTCTPTPELSISPSIVSPTPSPETQIGSPASANNNSTSAGSSANIALPTNGPETGHALK